MTIVPTVIDLRLTQRNSLTICFCTSDKKTPQVPQMHTDDKSADICISAYLTCMHHATYI